jgi:LysR family transcriptional regulator, hypochlorite-specific transcription factor HypT
MAWLPQTMAAEDLAAGRLVNAGGFSISVEIRLFRPLRRQSNTAEAFWKAMSRQSPAQGREPHPAASQAFTQP